MRTFMIAAALVLAASVTANAQLSNADCLACHDKVEAKQFAGSVHGPLGCTDCHTGITGPGPHDPAPKPVDCRAGLYAADGAAVYKAKCAGCHGTDGSGQTAMGKAMKLRATSDPPRCRS